MSDLTQYLLDPITQISKFANQRKHNLRYLILSVRVRDLGILVKLKRFFTNVKNTGEKLRMSYNAYQKIIKYFILFKMEKIFYEKPYKCENNILI